MSKMSTDKGGEFERATAKWLSLWASGGERKDIFWRTASSGGRHTHTGAALSQAGDLCATHESGAMFIDKVLVECKFYKRFDWTAFLFEGRGDLARFWHRCLHDAIEARRLPLLITKDNGRPIRVVTNYTGAQVLFPEEYDCVRALGVHAIEFTRLTDQVYSEVSARLAQWSPN